MSGRTEIVTAADMEDFIEGYRRFRAGTWRNERARFDELSKFGQKPRAGDRLFG